MEGAMKVKIAEIIQSKCPEKLKGEGASYLGHFNNEKILKEGHNTVAGFFQGFGQGLVGMAKGMINAKKPEPKAPPEVAPVTQTPGAEQNYFKKFPNQY
jgi:hypothetical protein